MVHLFCGRDTERSTLGVHFDEVYRVAQPPIGASKRARPSAEAVRWRSCYSELQASRGTNFGIMVRGR